MNTPIQVLHLRVVFYGHVQVHGDKPGMPLSNGIFDYLKNQQLVNTGIRIARRPSLDGLMKSNHYHPSSSSSSSPSPSSQQAECSKYASSYPKEDIEENHLDQSTIYYGTIQHKNDKYHDFNKIESSSSSKLTLNKQVDKFIHVIASKENSNGSFIHDTLSILEHNKDHMYELLDKKYQVKFKIPIPTSRSLPGSYQHPNYPIQYYTIAIMLCKNINKGTHYVSYVRIPIRFEPQVNVLSSIYAGNIYETDRLWLGHDASLLTRLLNLSQKYRKNRNNNNKHGHPIPSYYPSIDSSSSSDSDSIMDDQRELEDNHFQEQLYQPSSSSLLSLRHIPLLSDLWYKLIHHSHPHHSWMPLQQQHSSSSSSFSNTWKYPKSLDCTLELPRRAFCKGQPLPLSIQLFNGAGIRIAMVVIEMKLIRKIAMTCNVSEPILSEIDFESTSVFYGDEIEKPIEDNDSWLSSSITPPLTPLSDKKLNDNNNNNNNNNNEDNVDALMKRQPFFLFNNRHMRFDLSTIAMIPQHSPCSIMSSLTKDVYELEYELITKIKILESKNGPKLDASLDDPFSTATPATTHHHRDTSDPSTMTHYYARKKGSNQDILACQNDYKVFQLDPPKVNIVVGNVACKS
ncbi:unnamed protein product [Cunninghamella blakesleeana]